MKKFKLESVLSAIRGILLCPIGEVYEVLNFLTGDNLYTHQLPRAGEVCQAPVFSEHPFLKDIDLEGINPENWKQRLTKIKSKYPNEIELSPIENWKHVDPIDELQGMVGEKPIIMVKTP